MDDNPDGSSERIAECSSEARSEGSSAGPSAASTMVGSAVDVGSVVRVGTLVGVWIGLSDGLKFVFATMTVSDPALIEPCGPSCPEFDPRFKNA